MAPFRSWACIGKRLGYPSVKAFVDSMSANGGDGQMDAFARFIRADPPCTRVWLSARGSMSSSALQRRLWWRLCREAEGCCRFLWRPKARRVPRPMREVIMAPMSWRFRPRWVYVPTAILGRLRMPLFLCSRPIEASSLTVSPLP